METVVKMIFSSIKLYGTAYISFITKVYTYSFCAHSYYLFLYLVKIRYLKHSSSILCMILFKIFDCICKFIIQNFEI